MPEWITAELVWFIIGMALLVAEFVVPGLVIAFFGVGALLTALIVKAGWVRNTGQEILICAVLSVGLLLGLRKYVSKWFTGFTGDKQDLGVPPSGVAGKRVEVIEKITPNTQSGRVRLNGTPWKADADVEIEAGATVEIVEQSGLVLKVKPLEDRGANS